MQQRSKASSGHEFAGRQFGRTQVGRTLYRWAFLACMYTGLRALFNRWKARSPGEQSPLSPLHQTTIKAGRYGTLRVWVHRQSRQVAGRAGMLSMRQERAPIHPALYRYICMTSHFACGHLEVAFFEFEGQVTIYAARNSARSNAQRLGFDAVAQRLGSEQDDVQAVRVLVAKLEGLGLPVRMAPPQECVDLALDSRLVHPATLPRTRVTLERKYRRLAEALPVPSHESVHPSLLQAR